MILPVLAVILGIAEVVLACMIVVLVVEEVR